MRKQQIRTRKLLVDSGWGAEEQGAPQPGEQSSSRVSHSLQSARPASSSEAALGSHQEVQGQDGLSPPGHSGKDQGKEQSPNALLGWWAEGAGVEAYSEAFHSPCSQLRGFHKSHVKCSTTPLDQSQCRTQAGKICAGWGACKQEDWPQQPEPASTHRATGDTPGQAS